MRISFRIDGKRSYLSLIACQALAQCENTLTKLGLVREAVDDTAGAAKVCVHQSNCWLLLSVLKNVLGRKHFSFKKMIVILVISLMKVKIYLFDFFIIYIYIKLPVHLFPQTQRCGGCC